jgi:hypothetical protein
MRYLIISLIAAVALNAADAAEAPSTTFYQDVLPILQERCQSCHRAGEIGPMPLATYTETRPWAKAIRQSVIAHKRLPWNARRSSRQISQRPFAVAGGD